MSKLLRILQLNFFPRSPDAGLLVLRVWLGLSMMLLHGKGKLVGFAKVAETFPDPFGIGPKGSLALAVFGEVVCSLLIVLGLLTRFAALCAATTMGVAFFIIHKSALEGPASGEMAFIYLAGFVTLLISGGGRFSIDETLPTGSAPKK